MCACFHGRSGADCSLRSCKLGCSGRGLCSDGECSCGPGYVGAWCQRPTCPSASSAGLACSGHGICHETTCQCDEGWGGVDCATASCAGSCGEGACVDGRCACPLGKHGEHCELPCPPGTNGLVCTGHGICKPLGAPMASQHTLSAAMVVQRGDEAAAAAEREAVAAAAARLPSPIEDIDAASAVLASATGLPPQPPAPSLPSGAMGDVAPPPAPPAAPQVCHCEPGWYGHACGLKACPRDCHGRGRCLEGRCVCSAPYSGNDCGATLPPSAAAVADEDTTPGACELACTRKCVRQCPLQRVLPTLARGCRYQECARACVRGCGVGASGGTEAPPAAMVESSRVAEHDAW